MDISKKTWKSVRARYTCIAPEKNSALLERSQLQHKYFQRQGVCKIKKNRPEAARELNKDEEGLISNRSVWRRRPQSSPVHSLVGAAFNSIGEYILE